MLNNTAIKMVTSKLANASILSGSLVLVGGLVVWQIWSKQAQLQTVTSKLSDELQNMKKQIAEIKASNDGELETSLSSRWKKFFSR